MNINPKQAAASTPEPLLTALFEQTTARSADTSLQSGSTATPFSTFFWPALKYTHDRVETDRIAAEIPFADDIEWDMMNNGQIRKGKKEVLAWCWAGGFASHKEPVAMRNAATKEWGVWEYWNVGTLTKDIIEFARQSKWPFPANIGSFLGRTYKIPVCFVYGINAQGKINLVHEYVDMQSLMTQFA